mmetsp:Transcript_56054/g.102812  ORF Transcript_56054/g.102812 Transcript_56054/m.102812 type:complete len:900 (+) Transcript_56054:112-2811(+)
MAAGGKGSDADPLILESFLWGLLSAVSLNFGSIIGVTCLPRKKVRAILMSFGGGALLFALSIELFGHVLHSSEENDDTAPVWVMEGSAVVGGMLFAGLNRLLNSHGADLRKPSTTKGRFARLRQLLLRRLAWRLRKIELFSVLSLNEVRDLIQGAMYKERFNASDIIMSHESRDCGIFFIISGKVRLHIFDQELLPGQTLSDARLLEDHLVRTWDLGPNQVFGDMTVLTGTYITTMAIAHEVTKVLVLPGHELARLIDANEKVREKISVRAVERLRQIDVLRSLSSQALAALSAHCHTVTFQPGEVLFTGIVDENTAIICVVLGSIEITRHKTGSRKVLHANRLLCTEHLMFGHPSAKFTATALEPTSVIVIERADLNKAMPEGIDPKLASAVSQASHSVRPDMYLKPSQAGITSIVDKFEDDSTKSTSEDHTQAHAQNGCAVVVEKAECTPAMDSCLSKVGEGEVALPGQPEDGETSALAAEAGERANSPYSIEEKKDSKERATPDLHEIPCDEDFGQAGEEDQDVEDCLLEATVDPEWKKEDLDKVSPSPSEQRLLEHLGHDLGWDMDQEEDMPMDAMGKVRLARGGSMEELPVAFITDQELEDREEDLAEMRDARKMGRSSTVSNRGSMDLTNGEAADEMNKQGRLSYLHVPHVGEDAKLLEGQTQSASSNVAFFERIKEKERRRSTQLSSDGTLPGVQQAIEQNGNVEAQKSGHGHGHGHSHGHGGGHGANSHHAAVMVWLGILIDAVPESLVIGILMNKSAAEGKSSSGAALPFVIGVFLSNLPESMSSSGSMKAHGMRISTILMMWMTIVVLTAIGAMMGAIIFPPSTIKDSQTMLLVAAVEGVAAGAMLTMIAQTMMPEAFEQGGDVVGLSCLAGFLVALMVKLFPTGDDGH